MENTRAFWGALLLIGMIGGANLLMYGIAKSIISSGRKNTNFFESMGNMFNPSNQKKDNSMEELRKQIEELKKTGGDNPEKQE